MATDGLRYFLELCRQEAFYHCDFPTDQPAGVNALFDVLIEKLDELVAIAKREKED